MLVVYIAPNELGCTRVGITVSGRVGKAVVRNRVRRRLREALTQRFASLPERSDVVVAARPASATASWAELCTALDSVLNRARRRL
jgi:ribonuclease P protein component